MEIVLNIIAALEGITLTSDFMRDYDTVCNLLKIIHLPFIQLKETEVEHRPESPHLTNLIPPTCKIQNGTKLPTSALQLPIPSATPSSSTSISIFQPAFLALQQKQNKIKFLTQSPVPR